MIRLGKSLLMAALLGAAMLGWTSTTRADLQLQIIDSGGTITIGPLVGSPTSLPTGTLAYTGLSASGEFFVSALVTGYTQTGAQGELLTTDLSVTRLTAGTGSITFRAEGNNFTLPNGSLLDVFSGAGGTYTPQPVVPSIGSGGSAALTFRSWYDANNPLIATATPLPLQTPTPASSTVPATFATGEIDQIVSRPNPAYSLRNDTVITLTNNVAATTLLPDGSAVGGSVLGFQGHTVTRVVPAPPAMVLALSGLPLLGFGRWLRRRQAQVV